MEKRKELCPWCQNEVWVDAACPRLYRCPSCYRSFSFTPRRSGGRPDAARPGSSPVGAMPPPDLMESPLLRDLLSQALTYLQKDEPVHTVLEKGVLPSQEQHKGICPLFRVIFTSNPTDYAVVNGPQDVLLDCGVTIPTDGSGRDSEVAVVQALSGLSLAQAELIVDLAQAFRQMGFQISVDIVQPLPSSPTSCRPKGILQRLIRQSTPPACGPRLMETTRPRHDMKLEQTVGVLQASLEDLAQQAEHPRDLSHFHAIRAARATYQAVLALLEPVTDMIGPEMALQKVYLQGIIQACENAAELLRQVGER